MEQPISTQTGTKEIKKPGGKRRRRGGGISLLLFLLFVATIALFVWAEQQRRDAVSRLQETEQRLEEIQQSTQQNGEERAQQVLEQVRRHMDIPTEPQPTVATIVDVERLRESSDFYDKADNNDNLIITERRAILYDPDRDIILDVVPVQISQEQTPADPNASATPSPEGSPSPDPAAGTSEETQITPSPSPTTTP